RSKRCGAYVESRPVRNTTSAATSSICRMLAARSIPSSTAVEECGHERLSALLFALRQGNVGQHWSAADEAAALQRVRDIPLSAGCVLPELHFDRVGMGGWKDRPLASYSKGMRQRIGLAAALVNDPQLVVLDEPTDGVDPVGRREIRDLLIGIRDEGRTVLLNSHLLSEIENVCSRVAIMVQGRMVAQGTIDELTSSSRRYEIVVEGTAPSWCTDSASIHMIPPGQMIPAGIQGESCRLIFLGLDALGAQPILDRLRAEQRTVIAVQTVRESLEDLFMRAVTDPTTGLIYRPGAVT
ncbi:MAG: ATP-binding cassette domain-containing protein, partial [Planctomycetes bacterium]|nr:ATP-binding cassette domain-containing protein [Planctomycetota bacterium]